MAEITCPYGTMPLNPQIRSLNLSLKGRYIPQPILIHDISLFPDFSQSVHCFRVFFQPERDVDN